MPEAKSLLGTVDYMAVDVENSLRDIQEGVGPGPVVCVRPGHLQADDLGGAGIQRAGYRVEGQHGPALGHRRFPGSDLGPESQIAWALAGVDQRCIELQPVVGRVGIAAQIGDNLQIFDADLGLAAEPDVAAQP